MCIVKRDRFNSHERIQAIGGVDGGYRWQDPEDVAIRNINLGLKRYFVHRGGKSVWVVVAQHNGRPYLKTENDGYAPDNLLSLPPCP